MAKSNLSKPPPVAIALIDTHCLVREAIAAWMEQQGGLRVTWMGDTFSDLDAALDEGLNVSLVLVALGVGEDAGFATLERLRNERPQLPRAAYVHRHDEALLMRSYRCGAQTVLHDTVQDRAVLSMLNVVLAGAVAHSQLSQSLLLVNPDGLTREERVRADMRKRISPREWDVLVAAIHNPGYTSARLAKLLNVAPRTITTHFTNLFETFGVRSRPALMGVVQKMGLLEGPA